MKKPLNFMQIFGILLILASLLLYTGTELFAYYCAGSTAQITERLEAILPDGGNGNPGDYSEADMPVVQLYRQDFCGLLRVPSFGITLPIGASWDTTRIFTYPCRFWGSVYDSSMVIGGSDRQEMLDFCMRVDHGEKIVITDMTGTRFPYTVELVERRKEAVSEQLLEGTWDLTLFVKDSVSLEYIFVRCSFSPSPAV